MLVQVMVVEIEGEPLYEVVIWTYSGTVSTRLAPQDWYPVQGNYPWGCAPPPRLAS